MYRREIEEISTKQEGGSNPNDTGNNTVITRPFYPSSTSSWSKSGDPRIVRVPKEFGGKDRHSKVCTVRGLRDRRVRLSVPTAIQVYHLQARLGLDQPSKVVDWLLNAAKDDIDELPPLQIPPGVFIPQNLEDLMSNTYKDMVQEKRGYVEEGGESSKCLESLMNNSNNNSMTYNSLIRWDASNLLSLSHASQPPDEDHQYHNFHASNHMPTGLSLYPSQGLAHQSYFSSNDNVSVEDFEGSKHFGFQMLSSNSFNHHQQASQHQEQNVRPFHFSMMDNRERETSNESEYDCSR